MPHSALAVRTARTNSRTTTLSRTAVSRRSSDAVDDHCKGRHINRPGCAPGSRNGGGLPSRRVSRRCVSSRVGELTTTTRLWPGSIHSLIGARIRPAKTMPTSTGRASTSKASVPAPTMSIVPSARSWASRAKSAHSSSTGPSSAYTWVVGTMGTACRIPRPTPRARVHPDSTSDCDHARSIAPTLT